MRNIWKTALMFFVEGDGNWRHNYPPHPELFWPVGIFFAMGIVLAGARLWKRRAEAFALGCRAGMAGAGSGTRGPIQRRNPARAALGDPSRISDGGCSRPLAEP